MTPEENLKELLLKDLCARLPYGNTEIMVTEPTNDMMGEVFVGKHICSTRDIEDFILGKYIIRPYLRTLSSMTEEEKEELDKLVEKFFGKALDLDVQGKMSGEDNENKVRIQECFAHGAVTDMLNAHHLDYRGLIPKGLALEAPEGMYIIEVK